MIYIRTTDGAVSEMGRVSFFFFSRRRRHTRLTCDWSSDVCSSDLWVVAGLIIACLLLSACEQSAPSNEELTSPAKVEHIEGKDVSRVILTEEAVKRLGIETTQIRDEQVRGAKHKVVPYATVIYDLNG